MQTKVLYCGSFDPPTLGHLDIIQRASQIFPHVVVGLAENTAKSKKRLKEEDKLKFLQVLCRPFKNVEVVLLKGLASDWALKNGIKFFLRSIRGYQDLAQETSLAFANLQISNLETVFLLSSPSFHHISSSLIYELALLGHRLHGFVPDEVEAEIFSKLHTERF